ncbi:MAG: hypothetical protein GWP67_04385 [Gammaproteobacteria bacterium]|jgi:hypothetical protein|nr:hypothetical protein [Gammaproteobacteria bacterium]
MHTLQKILLASSLSILLPFAAYGQSINDLYGMSPEDRRTYMESMSDDERTAMREKWREEYENLPEEEKRAIREQRAASQDGRGRDREAMRQRWDSMSEEERAATKDRYQEQKERRREQWESMSDEERAAARASRGERKGQKPHHKDKGKKGKAKPSESPES